jgi:acyl dehydratase
MKLPPFMHAGHRVHIGTHVFTPQEIIDFARRYDPQPFHIDAEAARNSVLGGLCASGWHTVAVWMRKQRDATAIMLADLERQGYGRVEYGPSPGFRNLKWLRPVFAGDEIAYWNETVECRPSASRPGWHVFSGRSGGDNQKGEPVLTFESSVLIRYPA